MSKNLKFFKWALVFIFIVLLLLAIFLRLNYGGGIEYQDISTEPIYGEKDLELFFSYPEPLGNIAVSNDTSYAVRVFFTIHPESRPVTHKLVEIINEKAIPFPNEAAQHTLFITVLGIYTDQQNRLWTVDHGNHGFDKIKLTGFDLSTNKVIHEYEFPREVAERFSFFNDLSVAPDGKYVFISDVSFLLKNPPWLFMILKEEKVEVYWMEKQV